MTESKFPPRKFCSVCGYPFFALFWKFYNIKIIFFCCCCLSTLTLKLFIFLIFTFPSSYTCIQCGSKYCTIRCQQTHKDTRYNIFLYKKLKAVLNFFVINNVNYFFISHLKVASNGLPSWNMTFFCETICLLITVFIFLKCCKIE